MFEIFLVFDEGVLLGLLLLLNLYIVFQSSRFF